MTRETDIESNRNRITRSCIIKNKLALLDSERSEEASMCYDSVFFSISIFECFRRASKRYHNV